MLETPELASSSSCQPEMCKVAPFSRAQVKAFRRVIDFCYWRGIPIARKWPEWKYPAATDKQLEFQNVMRVSRVFLKEIDPAIVLFWHNIFQGKKPSWIDRYTSQFISAYQLLGAEIPPWLSRIQFDHLSPDLQVSFVVSGEGEYSVAALKKPLVQQITYKKTKGIGFPCYDAYYPPPLITKAAYLQPQPGPIHPSLISTLTQYRTGSAYASSQSAAIADAWYALTSAGWTPYYPSTPELFSVCTPYGTDFLSWVNERKTDFIYDFSAYPPEVVQQVTHLSFDYSGSAMANEIFPDLPSSQLSISGDISGEISIYPFSPPALIPVHGSLPYPLLHISIENNPAVYGFTYETLNAYHGWAFEHTLAGEFLNKIIYKATFLQAEVKDDLDDLFYLVYLSNVKAPIALPVPYNTITTL